MKTDICFYGSNQQGIKVMSSSGLEADINALASTIRARLRSHRLHKSRTRVYKWWDTTFGNLDAFARMRVNLARRVVSIACSNLCGLSATAIALGREWSIEGMVSVNEGVNVVVARVGR
jgi:hypothetical protein